MFINRKTQTGYTLVELVLAMAIFSFVLLIIVSSITGLYRIYRATAGIRDTQQQARSISEEITRAVRDSSYVVTSANAICLYDPTSRVSSTLRGPSEIFYVEGTAPLGLKLVRGNRAIAELALDGTTVCDPSLYTGFRDMTSPQVSVMLFAPVPDTTPTTLNTFVNYYLRLASTRTLADGSEMESAPPPFDLANPDNTGPICRDGVSYCSMTSIYTGVQARSKTAGSE